MKRVITYGTFDLLHYGHINLLRRAKELGDYLIVALSTDEFNWNQKKSDMHKYQIDVFTIGDDWKGNFDFLTEEGVDVIYLPRTPEISSSQIKNDLSMNRNPIKTCLSHSDLNTNPSK